MPYHFYNTINHLRINEEIILYDRVLHFLPEDEEMVKDLLKIEYETESTAYPFTAPAYNATAALWAAKTIYTACQLILYRENKEEELPQLLPAYTGDMDAAAMLSADLCLRFLPQVLTTTRHIDPEDALIQLLEKHLLQWHYSAIGHGLEKTITEDDIIFTDNCLQQLYIDRVIQQKDMQLALQPLLQQKIKAAMGIYASLFWKEFKTENINE
ncbi:hypothetical protein [Ferruginibacter sp.]